MTLTVTSLVLAALALCFATLAPRGRLLAGAALLFSVSLALPVHAPTLLAGAALVAAETAGITEAFALLAASFAGLATIAAPAALPTAAGLVAIASVGAMGRRALRSRPSADRAFDLAARAAVAIAVASECVPGHRLVPLTRVSALTIAASLAFVATVSRTRRGAWLAAKRHRASVVRQARRELALETSSKTVASDRAGTPPAALHDDLAVALRRIVHELRQPVGAASNALATGTLSSTDPATAQALRDLAASELHSALASLEHLARFARMTAGEPLELPAVDAVEIALGPHTSRVALDRSFSGSIAVDPAPLGYALDALVQNAHEASPASSILVSLRAASDPSFVVVTVSDDGPAPEERAMADAALPFFTTRAGHLGLGASMAARYATSTGGRFTLRREGDRTLAELHLPRKRTS